MARIFFVDKLIRSNGGHNLETNLRLVDAFAKEGFETCIIGNSRFKGDRPKNFYAGLNFDFFRIVLKDDRKRLTAIRAARQKLRKRLQFWEGLRAMPFGKAMVQLNEIKAGRDSIEGEIKNPFWLTFMIIGRLLGFLSFITLAAVTWPIRYVLFQIYRVGVGRASAKVSGFIGSRAARMKHRIVSISELRLLYIILTRHRTKVADEAAYVSSLIKSLSRFRPNGDDIIFFSTATVSELQAVAKALQAAPHLSAANWQFLFREPIFPAKGASFVVQSNIRPLRSAIMEFLREAPNFAFWCDTQELAEQYSHLGISPFGVVPIALPQLDPAVIGAATAPKSRLCLGYLGDARVEKGYEVLPALVKKLAWKQQPWLDSLAQRKMAYEREMMQVYAPASTGLRDRFLNARAVRQYRREAPQFDAYTYALYGRVPAFGGLIQSNFNVEGGTSRTRAARYRLMAQDDLGVEVAFKPFISHAYVDALTKCDIFVLFYTSWLYSAGSSGIFAEALAAGKPMIVTDDTWGGRVLRTRSAYVRHGRALMEQAIHRMTVSVDERALGRTFWRLAPKKGTHFLFLADVKASGVFDQLELQFEFVMADGTTSVIKRRVCDRGEGAVGCVRIPLNVRLTRVVLERLNAKLMPNEWTLTIGVLDAANAPFPLSAVGRVVAAESELLEAALEIGAFHEHYTTSALEEAAGWRNENSSDRFAKVVAHSVKMERQNV